MQFNQPSVESANQQVANEDTSSHTFIDNQSTDIDSLYNQVMGEDHPTQETTPVSDTQTKPEEQTEQPAPTEQAQPEQPAPLTNEQLYELKWGEEVKQVPLNKLTEYAQQGFDYNVKMRGINQAQEQLQQTQQEIESQRQALQEYVQVQEWAKQNPDLWNQALQNFRQAGQTGQANTAEQGQFSPEANSVISDLRGQIEKLNEQVTSISQFNEEAKKMQEDQALDNEVKQTMRNYSDLDWVSRDENGQTLEGRVLEHATRNGISNFSAAFKDLYHEQLIERARLLEREKLGEQRNNQPADLQNSSKPAGISEASDIRTKSYDQLAAEALEELGLSVD